MNKFKSIQIFEDSILICGQEYDGCKIEESHFQALAKFNELHQNKYFKIELKKVTFQNFVGVIQVCDLIIEILPKIDKHELEEEANKQKWQKALVEMLRLTRKLNIQQIDEANITKQTTDLLDIYFEWFLNEVQILIHQGLIKPYNKETSKIKELRGKLKFARHIAKNLIKKERLYTTHQVYDKDLLIYQILAQALEIINSITPGKYINSRCKMIQLNFPEITEIQDITNIFNEIPSNRKTEPYEKALTIARSIILNYANITNQNQKILVLLFDINLLWKEYIYVRLQQTAKKKGIIIKGQKARPFLEKKSIHPDIIIEKCGKMAIIDTKWKNIDNVLPSVQDLRQMYAYNEYWDSQKAMLLYPTSGNSTEIKQDDFGKYTNREKNSCYLGKINIFDGDKLDDKIGDTILKWFYIKNNSTK
ncbi:McrC family protein [Flavobacterium davisii]|uniref:Restriction endonuclease n=1 Tax=Flavobacterium columnare TaxID=996 RepID=A0A8G0KUN8_9FLAO|nr:McrC family protein [Flavobacterium davisii]QYS88797.1 restriction endonuclease [Flavobacterium davisii]